MNTGKQGGGRRISRSVYMVDSLLQGNFAKTFGVIIVLAVLVFGATWWVHSHYTSCKTDCYHVLLSLISPGEEFLALPVGEACVRAVIACVGCVLFTGVLVSAIVNWVDQRKSRWANGEARYGIKRNFIVVIGGHKLVPSLVAQLLAETEERIVILTQRKAEDLRFDIDAVVGTGHRHRIAVYTGSRTSEHELEQLYLSAASQIYIIGENRDLDCSDHDTFNLECLALITKLYDGKGDGHGIPTHVMFEYQSTFKAFQFTDMKHLADTPFSFVPFNYYELWGQKVFGAMTDNGEADSEYLPLDGGKGIHYDDDRHVHLIIVGMSNMGTALALQAVHLCHFPNSTNKALGRPRTLITFISRDADVEADYFKGCHDALFRNSRSRFVDAATVDVIEEWDVTDANKVESSLFLDVDWEFIRGDVANPKIREYMALSAGKPNAVCTIAICLPQTNQSAAAALYLPESVYNDAIQILVQQDASDAVIKMLHGGVSFEVGGYNHAPGTTFPPMNRYSRLKPFGMADAIRYIDFSASRAAFMIGAAYGHVIPDYISHIDNGASQADALKAFERAYMQKLAGDLSDAYIQARWHSSNFPKSGKPLISRKFSNLYHAYSIGYRCRSFDMLPATSVYMDCLHPELLAEVEHNRWNMEQLLLGYRPLYATESQDQLGLDIPEDKRVEYLKALMVHPDLVPYDRLGASSKANDIVLTSVIPMILFMREYGLDALKKEMSKFSNVI